MSYPLQIQGPPAVGFLSVSMARTRQTGTPARRLQCTEDSVMRFPCEMQLVAAQLVQQLVALVAHHLGKLTPQRIWSVRGLNRWVFSRFSRG